MRGRVVSDTQGKRGHLKSTTSRYKTVSLHKHGPRVIWWVWCMWSNWCLSSACSRKVYMWCFGWEQAIGKVSEQVTFWVFLRNYYYHLVFKTINADGPLSGFHLVLQTLASRDNSPFVFYVKLIFSGLPCISASAVFGLVPPRFRRH